VQGEENSQFQQENVAGGITDVVNGEAILSAFGGQSSMNDIVKPHVVALTCKNDMSLIRVIENRYYHNAFLTSSSGVF
jgi:hypothetical protein